MTVNLIPSPHSPHPIHRRTMFPFRLLFIGLTLVSLQVAINLVLYCRVEPPVEDPLLLQTVRNLQLHVQEVQAQMLPSPAYHDDGRFYPFTIRDSKRLSPVQIHPDFHIFDYVDTTSGNQQTTRATQLWLDAHLLGPAPCHRYMILCYKQKIIQVFDYLLQHTNASYYFYIEADNELCVSLDYIRDLTYRHERYFIGTGVGFSGWIMNRTFVVDFLAAFRPPHKHNNENPDPIGARLLMEKKAWTVTRQYLVSHTIKQGIGAAPLTIGKKDAKTGEVREVKHLPRCGEPKRTKWFETSNSTEDMHGWDFFDSDDCPPSAELYPCREDQYVNVSYGINDTFKVPSNGSVSRAQQQSNGLPRIPFYQNRTRFKGVLSKFVPQKKTLQHSIT